MRIVVMHAAGVGEQVEVLTHAVDGTAQFAVLEAEVFAPEVEELLHLVLAQLALDTDNNYIYLNYESVASQGS